MTVTIKVQDATGIFADQEHECGTQWDVSHALVEAVKLFEFYKADHAKVELVVVVK